MRVIVQSRPLENITILDFGHRLPAPLAGQILCSLGAKVIKVEDQVFKDPFCAGAFADFDPSFKQWYEQLNKNKEILRLDFKGPNIREEILELLNSADALINGLPLKIQESLGIDEASLRKLDRPIAAIDLKASKNSKSSMHDLNALAISGVLALHVQDRSEDIVSPPFLPFAGINFGHKVATDLLALLLKVRSENATQYGVTYLLESTQEVYNIFWPKELRSKRKKFLHNGRYPCYSLYRTKDDQYVALAAVEEKFWLEFCDVFKLDIAKEERFRFEDERVFNELSTCFKSYDATQLSKIAERHDFCLSLI